MKQRPPTYTANRFQPADSQLQRHLSNRIQLAYVALNCVKRSQAEYKELRRHWEAYGRLLDECQRRLEARQNTVESFIQDIEPPSLSLVIDSLLELENIEDHEHAE
ncbi:hypothetical protein GN958_ATG01913 [Phytophthora infestans]|uniref:Uncharacterized protein n=1 Tax=Phytophthora infestans TaxID=4787 RepID=A0A8S9VCF5_PHYIN|nr:hypothetical protein GN958_ATG01913 [Phytophthora infestans]